MLPELLAPHTMKPLLFLSERVVWWADTTVQDTFIKIEQYFKENKDIKKVVHRLD